MKKLSKIFISSMLVLAFMLPASAAFAVPFGDVARVPRGFWPLLEAYTHAVEANDSARIVAAGRNLIEFWLDGGSVEARAEQWGADVTAYGFIINNMWSVSNQLITHYTRLDDRQGMIWAYSTAYAFVDPYQALIPHIGGNADDMEFARTRIQNRLNSLNATISVFAEHRDGSGTTANFGVLHEPETGLFFGEQIGASAIMNGQNKPAAVTIYVEFETQNMRDRVSYDLNRNRVMHGINPNDYELVQIAWNFLHEGRTPAQVPSQEARVRDAARFLKELDLPILLRVGAEMDVWEHAATPEDFINAFRFIANIMRQEAPNVAMVYSVNFVSAQGTNWQTFYPGDDYVDWVGVSLYTSRYFQGNPNTDDVTAAIYRTGQFADPISFVQQLVDEFGDRKPLLVTEGGVALYNIPNNEDLTEWALPLINAKYSYIPVLFPEVKAMFWFNVRVAGTTQRFDFDASPEARALYSRLTNQEFFLGRGRLTSAVTFTELGTAVMPANAVTLLTYVPFFDMDDVVVQYWLDGRWVGQSDEVPFRRVLNLSHLDDGDYTLLVRLLSEGRMVDEVEFNLEKDGGYAIISTRNS